ncbi:MAG: phage tail protein [Aeromonas sp.]
MTEKGLSAALQAASLGKSVEITHVGVTDTPGVPSVTATALPGEVFRLPVSDAKVITDQQVNITALIDDTKPSLSIHGVGFYLADGTLFAVYQQQSPMLNHTAGTTLLVAMDLVMSNVPASSVIVQSTGAQIWIGDFVPVQRTINKKALTDDVTLTPTDIGAAAAGHSHSDLVPTARTINNKALTSNITLSPSDVGAATAGHGHSDLVPTARTVNGKALTANITLTPEDVGAAPSSHTHTGWVPDTRTVNGKRLNGNITLSAGDVGAMPADAVVDLSGYVPITRTVNKKPLNANITLSADDVGAVPTARTVNGKPLSGNVTLSHSDVGAAASDHAHSGYAPSNHSHDYVPTARKVNNKALSADITLSAGDVGAMTSAQVSTAISTAIEAMKEALFPVGMIIQGAVATNPATLGYPGTWTRLDNDMSLISSTGTLGVKSGNNAPTVPVPQHSHSWSGSVAGAGKHAHGRGTMEIDATWTGAQHRDLPSGGGGAVSASYSFYREASSGNHWGTASYSFAASRSWTGETSYAEDHTHAVTGTVGSAGNAGATLDVRGYRMTVAMWQRTA